MRYFGFSLSLLLLAACTPSGSAPPPPEQSAPVEHPRAVASAAVGASAPSVGSAAPQTWGPPGAPCSAALVKKVTDAADAYRSKTGVSGVVVAVWNSAFRCVVPSGTLSNGGAAVTADTIFAMGSVQKVFNATLLAYAIEEGNATINDLAFKYLPAANGKILPATVPFAQVTLKELVTHTSSLPSTEGGDDKDGWGLYRNDPVPDSTIKFLKNWKPKDEPGTNYDYSNLGFVLAGYAAVAAAKTPYTTLLGTVVTTPLGMANTGPTLCPPPASSDAGADAGSPPACATGYNASGKPQAPGEVTGLWTTGNDMQAFLAANIYGVLPEPQKSAFALTHAPLFDKGGNKAVGMGWEISGTGADQLLAKDGKAGGFSSWIGFRPQSNRGVVVLTNGQDLGGSNAPELGREILKSLH